MTGCRATNLLWALPNNISHAELRSSLVAWEKAPGDMQYSLAEKLQGEHQVIVEKLLTEMIQANAIDAGDTELLQQPSGQTVFVAPEGNQQIASALQLMRYSGIATYFDGPEVSGWRLTNAGLQQVQAHVKLIKPTFVLRCPDGLPSLSWSTFELLDHNLTNGWELKLVSASKINTLLPYVLPLCFRMSVRFCVCEWLSILKYSLCESACVSLHCVQCNRIP